MNRLLETGRYSTAAELATAEKINPSYVSRVLRLTLLAPDIVEAIVEGRQTNGTEAAVLLRPITTDWVKQRVSLTYEAVSISSLHGAPISDLRNIGVQLNRNAS